LRFPWGIHHVVQFDYINRISINHV
jgi:hypothetical protein